MRALVPLSAACMLTSLALTPTPAAAGVALAVLSRSPASILWDCITHPIHCVTDLVDAGPPVAALPPPPAGPPPAPPPLPPAPPPPPPPPVFEARQFIVYFPFDQAVVTPEGQQVLSEAVTYAGGGHPTRVTIVGHTDTSGSDPDSMALSERRAKAAADALANLGVSRSALSVDWKGKTEPAVQTGDGVPEPLNNRVTIDIAF